MCERGRRVRRDSQDSQGGGEQEGGRRRGREEEGEREKEGREGGMVGGKDGEKVMQGHDHNAEGHRSERDRIFHTDR